MKAAASHRKDGGPAAARAQFGGTKQDKCSLSETICIIDGGKHKYIYSLNIESGRVFMLFFSIPVRIIAICLNQITVVNSPFLF